MLHPRRPAFFVPAVAFALLLVMTGCEAPAPAKKQPAPTAASTQAYVKNLSLAHLAYERQPENAAAAVPYVTGLNQYALKKNPKPMPVTVVVLGYSTRSDGKTRKLMIPVSSATSPDFRHVGQVTQQLAPSRPEYRTVLVRTATLATREPVPFNKARPEEVQGKMEDLYQTVYESAQVPPRKDGARVQIGLTRFFMNAGIRDAAYVSLENAKELLAGVDTSSQGDANEVQGLSKQLEELENALHKKMPYTF